MEIKSINVDVDKWKYQYTQRCKTLVSSMECLFPASVVEITFPVDFHAGIRIIWELAFTENITTQALIHIGNMFLGHSSFFAQTRIRMIDMAKRKTRNAKSFVEQLGLLGQRHLDEFYVAREGGIMRSITKG
jgi:hypothetical protein